MTTTVKLVKIVPSIVWNCVHKVLSSRIGYTSFIAATLSTFIGWKLYKKSQQQPKVKKIPLLWRQVGYISKIYIYPLKSGKGMPVLSAYCTDAGLKQVKMDDLFQMLDRSFVIYQENCNSMLSPFNNPRMLLIGMKVVGTKTLMLEAPNVESVCFQIPTLDESKIVALSGSGLNVLVQDCGTVITRWLSLYLLGKYKGLHLGYCINDKVDESKMGAANKQQYLNDPPFLLVTKSSVEDLNARLPSKDRVSDISFRPNIVISNNVAFEEDHWDWIKMNNVIMEDIKPCARCMLTTVNPKTATFSQSKEPLKTLKEYRKVKMPSKFFGIGRLWNMYPEHWVDVNKKPVFGVYASLCQPGRVHVGDPVYICEDGIIGSYIDSG